MTVILPTVTPLSMASIIAFGIYAVTNGCRTNAGTQRKKNLRLFLSHFSQLESIYLKLSFIASLLSLSIIGYYSAMCSESVMTDISPENRLVADTVNCFAG